MTKVLIRRRSASNPAFSQPPITITTKAVVEYGLTQQRVEYLGTAARSAKNASSRFRVLTPLDPCLVLSASEHSVESAHDPDYYLVP